MNNVARLQSYQQRIHRGMENIKKTNSVGFHAFKTMRNKGLIQTKSASATWV